MNAMASKVCISDIKHCTIKSPSDIPESRSKEGRLPAGSVVNRIQPGQTIDVIILKKSPSLLCDTSIEINETDIRKRIAYKHTDITTNSFKNQRLPVGVKFFRDIQETDTIYLILHK